MNKILNNYNNLNYCPKLSKIQHNILISVREAMEYSYDMGAGPTELRAIGSILSEPIIEVTANYVGKSLSREGREGRA